MDVEQRMSRKAAQVVLVLLLLMAVFSPFMQISSPDQFPIAGDDLETQIICGLCGIGILLVLARILQLVQKLGRSSFVIPPRAMRSRAVEESAYEPISPHLILPLRL